jgi:uncharacterized membrane protein YbaN (DUF454 family)
MNGICLNMDVYGGFILFFLFALPFILSGFILWNRSRNRWRHYELQAKLYLKALEKGQEILPPDFNSKARDYLLEISLFLLSTGFDMSVYFMFFSFELHEIESSTLKQISMLIN